MGAENAGKTLPAVEGDPREPAAVVVQKSRRKAHAAFRRDVGARRVVVGTVEIFDLTRRDKAMLNENGITGSMSAPGPGFPENEPVEFLGVHGMSLR